MDREQTIQRREKILSLIYHLGWVLLGLGFMSLRIQSQVFGYGFLGMLEGRIFLVGEILVLGGIGLFLASITQDFPSSGLLKALVFLAGIVLAFLFSIVINLPSLGSWWPFFVLLLEGLIYLLGAAMIAGGFYLWRCWYPQGGDRTILQIIMTRR